MWCCESPVSRAENTCATSCKAHRRVYHSTLDWRVIKNKKTIMTEEDFNIERGREREMLGESVCDRERESARERERVCGRDDGAASRACPAPETPAAPASSRLLLYYSQA